MNNIEESIEHIRSYLERTKISGRAFAKKSGVHERCVRRIKSGEKYNPRAEFLFRMLNAIEKDE